MRERTVEAYFNRRVKETGGEVRKAQWIGRSHAPDRYAWWPVSDLWRAGNGLRPRAVWVELKRPGKDARAGQAREHDRMRAAGLPVYVADTFDKVDWLIGRYGLTQGEKHERF